MHEQLTTLDQLVQLMDPDLHLHLEKLESTNFFFFFRMLLVLYKREFDWSDTLRLWEILWTDFLSSSFHLFITLAILEKHRDPIMNHLRHSDEMLKYSTFQPRESKDAGCVFSSYNFFSLVPSHLLMSVLPSERSLWYY